MLKVFLSALLGLFFLTGFANAEPLKPLPSEQAFTFSSYVDEQKNITFQWKIAPGYYLYSDKLRFSIEPLNTLKFGHIAWPQTTLKQGKAGESYPIYSGVIKFAVPLVGQYDGPLSLVIHYQGCSFGGFCYAPVQKYLEINPTNLQPLQDLTPQVTVGSKRTPVVSDQDLAGRIFSGHSYFFVILSFMGLGLLIAFTPCVLPMIPILSAIIVGQGKKVTTLRAFSLSLAYVLGMAITYALVGLIVASLGGGIQALFQKTWVLILFSGLFLVLALSLFGLFDVKLFPQAWQNHVHMYSQKQKAGTYVGVFLMGALSTLILSPCVSAPLVGVLAYIAQSGDKVLGATALLALGLGMGMPLLLIGTSAGKWLPKAGPWMDFIKKIFGILMVGVAIWMLERIISGPFSLFLWAILVLGAGLFLALFYRSHPRAIVFRLIGTILLVYGIILLIGAGLGNADPFAPWASNEAIIQRPLFSVVKSEAELNQRLAAAKAAQQPVILDFYAKWCVSCVFADRHIFNTSQVQAALDHYVRLRLDVTDNNEFDKAVMQRFKVVAPPTVLFFTPQGDLLAAQAMVGETTIAKLLQNLELIKDKYGAK